jgi:hypothetical protein
MRDESMSREAGYDRLLTLCALKFKCEAMEGGRGALKDEAAVWYL